MATAMLPSFGLPSTTATRLIVNDTAASSISPVQPQDRSRKNPTATTSATVPTTMPAAPTTGAGTAAQRDHVAGLAEQRDVGPRHRAVQQRGRRRPGTR